MKPFLPWALGRSVVSNCSPRNVIVAQVERLSFAAYCERLPIGPGYRSVDGPSAFRSVRACLYVGGFKGSAQLLGEPMRL